MTKTFRTKRMLKHNKKFRLYHPNDTTFNLYIYPAGAQGLNFEFTDDDLKSIVLLDEEDTISEDFFDPIENDEAHNIYELLAEGVLEGKSTGADLGIYNYKVIDVGLNHTVNLNYIKSPKIEDIDDLSCKDGVQCFDEEDFDFKYCMLAQEDSLGGEKTQIIRTFKGYLEIVRPISVLRRYSDDKQTLPKVFVSEDYIDRFHLRTGDEVVCTYIQSKGQYVIKSIIEINGVPYYNWCLDRPLYRDIEEVYDVKTIDGAGEYTDVISDKFDLSKGDNVFMYINKNTRKANMLMKFVDELSEMFDKVIYINPQFKHYKLSTNKRNVIKFCASASTGAKFQLLTALTGIAHARRLVELGKNVAVVVDDINSIALLDKEVGDGRDLAVSKSVLTSTIHSRCGSCTMFTLIPLLSDAVNSFKIHDIFRSLESIGMVVDNNEIDLFNSYRR